MILVLQENHDLVNGIMGKGQEIVGNERVFKELEKPHMQVHDLACKAVSAYNNGEKAIAEEYLRQLSDVSHVVIEKLQELQTIIIGQKESLVKR